MLKCEISVTYDTLLFRFYVSHAMEQSPSREASRSAVGEEVFHIVRNQEVHYRIDNSPPHAPPFCQTNPVHALPPRITS